MIYLMSHYLSMSAAVVFTDESLTIKGGVMDLKKIEFVSVLRK